MTTIRGTTGLVNVGNTCFMNSTLQCLAHCMDLTIYILEQSYTEHLDTSKPETRLLMKWVTLLHEMWGNHRIIQPSSFVVELRNQPMPVGFNLRFGSHCDSHEFGMYFIDSIHRAIARKTIIDITGKPQTEQDKKIKAAGEIWKATYEKEYSFMLELLYGQYIVKREGVCGHSSYSYDPFNCVILPVRRTTETLTMKDCFEQFVAPEKMVDPANLWKCETCVAGVAATKTFRFWKLPQVLVVCLKRFDNMQRRINTAIDFTSDLDLSLFRDVDSTDSAKYSLVGFTNHYGTFMGGHYTAVCKNIDGLWYEYDDSRVTHLPGGPGSKYETNAYTLFYERIGS